MREQLEKLYNKLYNQDVYLIGGGYSVQDTDLNKLQNRNTIAINDAYEIFPNATALFWGDSGWFGKHGAGLITHSTKLRFHARNHGETHIKKNILAPGDATVLRRTGDYGFDPDPDSVRGNNSGVQCLNFAINMGAKRIYLIGFDMRDSPLQRGKTHYHDNRTLPMKHDTYSRLFIPSMISLDKEVRRLNIKVEVINCSKTSAITCFRMGNVP